MNLLVDTNVVISALIRDGIPRRVVNEVVARDNWFWIVTEEIETEYHALLARPRFKIPSAIFSKTLKPSSKQSPSAFAP
jgi:predicted nucleic acid-binding protein